MAEDRKPRPVSGEIMTGDAAGQDGSRHGVAREAAVDAEYETVAVDAPEPEGDRGAARRFDAAEKPKGMDSLRGGSDGSRRRERGGPVFWLFGAVLVIAAFWISGGHALVRHYAAPSSVPAEAMEAGDTLHIALSRNVVDETSGRPLLVIDGEAVNAGPDARPLPPIEIRVVSGDGRLTRYRMSTTRSALGPGERHAFSSRLEAPQEGVESVSVVFAEEGDED